MSKVTVTVTPTPWSPAKAKEIWDQFDFNRNGFLSLAEIDRAVLEVFPNMHKHKPAIMRAYKASDVSRDGYIQFKEFVDLLNKLAYYDELWKKFQVLDKSGDRRLSFQEFKQAHQMLGIPVSSDADMKRVFDSLDTNHGGYILFDEFCHFFVFKLASTN